MTNYAILGSDEDWEEDRYELVVDSGGSPEYLVNKHGFDDYDVVRVFPLLDGSMGKTKCYWKGGVIGDIRGVVYERLHLNSELVEHKWD